MKLKKGFSRPQHQPKPPAKEEALAKPLICRCQKSTRFMPLYRFSSSGCQIQLTPHPPTIKCGECGQWYRWETDGWVGVSQLDDLEEYELLARKAGW